MNRLGRGASLSPVLLVELKEVLCVRLTLAKKTLSLHKDMPMSEDRRKGISGVD